MADPNSMNEATWALPSHNVAENEASTQQDRDTFMTSEEFTTVRELIQSVPEMLEAILQQIEQGDSLMSQAMNSDRDSFVQLLLQGTDLADPGQPASQTISESASDTPNVTHIESVEGFDPMEGMSPEEVANYQLALAIQAQEDAGFENRHSDRDMPPETFECACGEVYTSTSSPILLNCGCVRCEDCLNQNVSVGLECKKNFPPKCHGPIDIDDVMHHLHPEVVARWTEVQEEYTDLSPVYCGVKTCSKYLSKATYLDGGASAKCDSCDELTCTACSALNTDHESDSCPDRLAKLDRELMEKKKWKSCPGCKEMIEKSEGCDHMECECGQAFCYQCGRAYNGGLPCNCTGEREWVEEDPDENNPLFQQQMLDDFAGRAGQFDEQGRPRLQAVVLELHDLQGRVQDLQEFFRRTPFTEASESQHEHAAIAPEEGSEILDAGHLLLENIRQTVQIFPVLAMNGPNIFNDIDGFHVRLDTFEEMDDTHMTGAAQGQALAQLEDFSRRIATATLNVLETAAVGQPPHPEAPPETPDEFDVPAPVHNHVDDWGNAPMDEADGLQQWSDDPRAGW